MISKLARLLGTLDLEGVGIPRWSDVVTLDGGARLPVVLPIRGNYLWNWGFNALVLDRRGAPRYFCKCRPPSPEVQRTTRLRVLLSHDPVVRGIVPLTWSGGDAHVHLDVSPFLPGRLYDVVLPSLGRAAWGTTLVAILDANDRLARRAPEVMPELAGAPRVGFRAEAESRLDRLAAVGFAAGDVALLGALLDAGGDVPARPQHVDLWARNVIEGEAGQWCVLDFDIYGDVRVPLYDACHLVCTSTARRAEAAHAAPRAWVDRLADGEDLVREGVAALRWAIDREQLDGAASGSALTYYLIENAVRLYERGAERQYWELAMEEVHRLVAHVRAGRKPESLIARAAAGVSPGRRS